MDNNKVKGITIEIDGNTSKLNAALKDTNKNLVATASELRQVEKGLKLDPSNITLLNQKQQLLTKAFEDSTKKLETLRKAKEQADNSADVDKNSAAYRQLERQIELTKKSVEGYGNQLEDTKTKIKNAELNTSLFYEKITALATGLTALKEVASTVFNVVSKLGGSFANTVIDSGKLADDINTLAKQFNMTTDQVQEFQKAAALIDVDFNTIASSYNKLTQQMNSKNADETFGALGVSIKDANGEFKDINTIFSETISALGKIDNETEKDAQAMKIFGKGASSLATLIDGGAETLAEFSEYLHENSLILSTEQLTSLNDMNDAYDTLQVTIQTLGSKIGIIFAEPFKRAFEIANEVSLKFFSYLDDVDIQPLIDAFLEVYRAIYEKLQPTFEEMGMFFSETLMPMLSDMWLFFKDNILPILLEVGGVVLDVVVNAFENAWTIFKTVLTVVEDIWDMLKNLYKVLEDTGAIDTIKGAFEGFLTVIQTVLDTIKSLYEWLGNVIGKVSEFISSGVSNVANWFGGLFGSGGYGSLPYASGGFASGGINMTTNITVNTSREITRQDVEGWSKTIADRVNLELGRRI